MSSVSIQLEDQLFEIDLQPFDDLPKLLDKMFLLHNKDLKSYSLFYADRGTLCQVPETVPMASLGIANRSILLARAKENQTRTRAEELTTTPTQRQSIAQPALISKSASPSSQSGSYLNIPQSDPFGTLEQTLTRISPRGSFTSPPPVLTHASSLGSMGSQDLFPVTPVRSLSIPHASSTHSHRIQSGSPSYPQSKRHSVSDLPVTPSSARTPCTPASARHPTSLSMYLDPFAAIEAQISSNTPSTTASTSQSFFPISPNQLASSPTTPSIANPTPVVTPHVNPFSALEESRDAAALSNSMTRPPLPPRSLSVQTSGFNGTSLDPNSASLLSPQPNSGRAMSRAVSHTRSSAPRGSFSVAPSSVSPSHQTMGPLPPPDLRSHIAPHLSLLLDAVEQETSDLSRDRGEEIELKSYALESLQTRLAEIQSARRAADEAHTIEMQRWSDELVAAQSKIDEELRLTRVGELERDSKKLEHERRLTLLEGQASAYQLARLELVKDSQTYAESVTKQMGLVSMAREEHSYGAGEERKRALARLADEIESRQDLADELFRLLATRRGVTLVPTSDLSSSPPVEPNDSLAGTGSPVFRLQPANRHMSSPSLGSGVWKKELEKMRQAGSFAKGEDRANEREQQQQQQQDWPSAEDDLKPAVDSASY